MAKVTHLELPEDTVGQVLRSMSALVFDVPNDKETASHEAICLHFDSSVISIRALTDTSELCVDTKRLEIPAGPDFAGCYTI